MDKISNAVPESRLSPIPIGRWCQDFQVLLVWELAEPIEVTIPSPTRAKMVSSPAPPTSCRMFARTVTLALPIS